MLVFFKIDKQKNSRVVFHSFTPLLRAHSLVMESSMRIISVGVIGLFLLQASVANTQVEYLAASEDIVIGSPFVTNPGKAPALLTPVTHIAVINRESEKWPFTPLPERAMPPPLWCDNAEQTGLTGTCTHPNSSAADRSTLAEGHKAARRWSV